MNNKQFKKLLKETISHGATSLFEEEEASLPDSLKKDEDEKKEDEKKEDEKKDSTLKSDDEKALAAGLKTALKFTADVKKAENFDLGSFSKIFAYYFLAMYYDDTDEWEASLSSANVFNQNVGTVLSNHAADKDNIICTFAEIIDWILEYPVYKNSDTWVARLRTQSDQTMIRKILNTLNSIEKKKYSLSSANIKVLKSLIVRAGSDFKMDDCPTDSPVERIKIRTKKQQPMSLESLKAMIKKTDARDYAHKIINALKTDMKDLRVRVNEVREKTPLLTNTIKALQSIPDKEIQKIALKSILDFFRVNNLQISDKTQSKLSKAGILSRQDNRNPQSNNADGNKENSEDAEVQDKEQKFNSDLEKDDSIDKEEKEVIKSTASQVKDKLGQAALAAWYGLPVDNLYNIVKEGASGNIKGVIGNIFMMLAPLDAGAKMMQAAGMGDSFSKFTDKVKEGDFLQAWDELIIAMDAFDPLSKIHMLRTFATFMGKLGPKLGMIISMIDAVGLMLSAGAAVAGGTATTGVGGAAAGAATAAGWKIIVSKILKSGLKPVLVWLVEEFGNKVGYSDQDLAQIKEDPENTIKNKKWVMSSFFNAVPRYQKGAPPDSIAKSMQQSIKNKAFKVLQDQIDQSIGSELERADTEEVPKPNADNNNETNPAGTEGLFTESLFNHAPNFNEQRYDMLIERFNIK